MVSESDLRALIIDDEARRWHKEKIGVKTGWLADWDGDGFALENYRPFLKYLLAYDLETRELYLKKRRQNDDADAPDLKFDLTFLRELLDESRKRGEKEIAKKAAALYFLDDDLRDWYRNCFLNAGVDWYNPARDDAFLASILIKAAFRVKTPDILRKIFLEWILPFAGTLNFRRAQKFGYQIEDWGNDVYERLFSRVGRRENAENSIDYWLKDRPTETLKNWVELEAYRTLEQVVQRRRREKPWTLIGGGDETWSVEANTGEFDEEETLRVDLQTLFDRFYADDPLKACLLTSYWGSTATFDELVAFWNKNIAGSSLGQRYRRALDDWREFCEKELKRNINAEVWKDLPRTIKGETRTDDIENETTQEDKTLPLGRAPKSKDWLKNVKFLPEAKPTKEDETLFNNLLESKRINETSSFERLFAEKTQRMGLAPLVREQAARRDKQPSVVIRQNSPLSSGSPILIPVAKILRRYWRYRYAANTAATFWYEAATAARDSAEYWRAVARVPLLATEPDAEIAFVISGYDKLYSWPGEVRLGKIKAPVVHGVALFKLSEFRMEIEKHKPVVTMVLRSVENGRWTRWHVKRESVGKLLLQKPVVPDDE